MARIILSSMRKILLLLSGSLAISRRIFLILESIIRAMRFRLIFAGFLSAVLAVGIHAQKAADGDWPMYGRDLAGTKFPPLKQVNADNVARLQPAWTLTLVDRPQGQGRGRGRSEE